jgi:hypothetical protein
MDQSRTFISIPPASGKEKKVFKLSNKLVNILMRIIRSTCGDIPQVRRGKEWHGTIKTHSGNDSIRPLIYTDFHRMIMVKISLIYIINNSITLERQKLRNNNGKPTNTHLMIYSLLIFKYRWKQTVNSHD